MNSLKLNFLPLEKQFFTFRVFRKEIEGEIEKMADVKWYRLYPDIETQERKNYLVSFCQRDDYESFICNQKHNIELTKWYLFEGFKKKILDLNIPDISLQDSRKVREIQFTIAKYNEGKQLIILSPYYLSSEDKFGFLLDFRFKKADEQSFNKEIQRLSLSLDDKFRSNKDYYFDKYKIFQTFLNNSFKRLSKIEFSENEFCIINELYTINYNLLDKKQYVFSNNRISNSQFLGIKNYGPYESLDHDVKFLFIFEDRFKTFANDVFLSLYGRLNPGTFLGMDSMFNLKFDKNRVERIPIPNVSTESLSKAIDLIIETSKTQNAIAIFIEDYSEEDGNSKPYYFLKYHLLKNNIPLQVLNYQKLSVRNTLKWSTSNIGLQIFSKLGGKPWIVKPSNTNCLILGIGSSHKIDNETNNIKKYFAYSICLDSSGLYKKLEVLAEADNEETYLGVFERNLVQLLKSADFTSYKSCVLHLPFKIKNSEIDILKRVIHEVTNLNFTAVKVNVDNRYFGFSNHNTLVPYESSYIQLARNQFLVWFEGLSFGKEIVDKRLSNPVHIEFLNLGNKIIDFKPYLQDIINLSGANWRGFNAKSIPISIYYSKIITEYISEFGDLVGVDKISVSNDKPWFL